MYSVSTLRSVSLVAITSLMASCLTRFKSALNNLRTPILASRIGASPPFGSSSGLTVVIFELLRRI